MAIESELKRKDGSNNLVNWTLVTDSSSSTGLADPVIDTEARTKLESIKGKLDSLIAGQEGGLAKDSTLIQVRDYLDTVETRLNVLATEATLGSLLSAVDALEALTVDVKRSVTDQRILMDYAARTDGNPVYIGKALQATATSGSWVIQRITYDGSNRATDVQVLVGSWDNRSGLGWA